MLSIAPIVADISPQDVGQIIISVLGGAGILGTTYMVGKSKAVSINPQPLEVKQSGEPVTRGELEKREEKLGQDIRNITSRIDAIAENSAEMRGKMDAMASNQQQILNLLMHEK